MFVQRTTISTTSSKLPLRKSQSSSQIWLLRLVCGYCAQRKNESSLDSLRWRVSNVISIYVTNALEMKVPCRGFFPARVMVRTSLESSRKVVSCDLVAYFPERCFYQKEHTNSRHRLVSIRIFARDDRRADWQRSHPDTMAVCVIDHVCLDWYIDIIRLSGPEIGKTLLGRRALIVVSVKSSVWIYLDFPSQDEVDDTRKTLQ